MQEYKSENAQLEDLLAVERKEKNLYDTRIKQLKQEISLSKVAASAVEAELEQRATEVSAALKIKNPEDS